MAHQPIQFGPSDGSEKNKPNPALAGEIPGAHEISGAGADAAAVPVDLDLKKDESLTVRWNDGRVSVYPLAYLRRNSPSAEAKAMREDMAKNPLTVLPASAVSNEPLKATGAELIGNYALRVEFSDGHRTGLYTWAYLREIDPGRVNHGDKAVDPDVRVRP